MTLFNRLLGFISLFFVWNILSSAGCIKTTAAPKENKADVASWMTTADAMQLLKPQAGISFSKSQSSNNIILVDTSETFQTIDGFGYTLTGGSAMLLGQLPNEKRLPLLRELFSQDPNAIGISYLRVSIGASDLDAALFSYNDLLPGETDTALARFTLKSDRAYLLPLLKEILQINPAIKIMGSPWSAPKWMKDNNNTIGGSLKPEYYSTYAQYFVKYIQQMKAEGIIIDAVTPQNEPLHPGNNPSMYMTAAQQADLIKNHLGPAFQRSGIQTKIIIYDHNADRPDYPLAILNDAGAKPFIDGTAFHLYAGDVDGLSLVRNAHPDKNIYFTEQWTGAKGTFDGDLKWHIKNIIIGSMRNWSRVALEWNLANDPTFNPHTPGGCTECKGALTIGPAITRNVGYYIIAHASKFVPPGSIRIGSNSFGNVHTVAFKTPSGKKVLIALNDGTTPITFNIRFSNNWAAASIAGNAVVTYTWQ